MKLPPRRRGSVWPGLLVMLVFIAAAGYFGYQKWNEEEPLVRAEDLITSAVVQGPFDHVVVEQGEIESSRSTEILCQVRSRGNAGVAVLWVIEEGSLVEEGDKLIELDSSQLEVEEKEDRIEVITAEASVASAAALVEQAKIAREEYLEGIFKTEEKAIESEIAIAEQELRKAQLAMQSSQRLVAKGLVKALQLEADQFAMANTRNQLEAAQGRLKVLRELTRRKMLVQFDSDIEAASAALSAARAELLEEQTELAEITQQIANCIITAPTAGVVVHANEYSRRGGNAEFVLEPGATVRERQALIRLPDPSKMQVNCKVNESRVTMLRPGMAAKIRIDALPSTPMVGRVTKVNRYAEPGSWYSSNVKEYGMAVEIIDPPQVIRTGMTASVEVFVEQLPLATQIPIEALYEHGGTMYSLVQTGPLRFETRQVSIGATNDTMADVRDGVAKDETVILNLREHLTLLDLPEIEVDDNSDMAAIAADSEAAPADEATAADAKAKPNRRPKRDAA